MRYLRFKELRQRVPLGRTTIWRMMREGRFPQSRRIGKVPDVFTRRLVPGQSLSCHLNKERSHDFGLDR